MTLFCIWLNWNTVNQIRNMAGDVCNITDHCFWQKTKLTLPLSCIFVLFFCECWRSRSKAVEKYNKNISWPALYRCWVVLLEHTWTSHSHTEYEGFAFRTCKTWEQNQGLSCCEVTTQIHYVATVEEQWKIEAQISRFPQMQAQWILMIPLQKQNCSSK